MADRFDELVQVDEGVLATSAPLAIDALERVLGLVRHTRDR